MQDALGWAIDQPTFAGQYYDHTQGGMPVFLFAGGASAMATDLSTLIPSDVDFAVSNVTYRLNDLQALQRKITSNREALSALGINLMSVNVDVPANRIGVGIISPITEADSLLMSTADDRRRNDAKGHGLAWAPSEQVTIDTTRPTVPLGAAAAGEKLLDLGPT